MGWVSVVLDLLFVWVIFLRILRIPWDENQHQGKPPFGRSYFWFTLSIEELQI